MKKNQDGIRVKQRKEPRSAVRAADSIQTKITGMIGSGDDRFLKLTRVSGTANLAVGISKLVLGILTMSVPTCVSALHTFGMVTAKSFALAGTVKAENEQEQYQCCFISGAVLILTSLLFTAYSVRILRHPAPAIYNIYSALAIAVFTFAELGISIRGVLAVRGRLAPPVYAVKMINLASSLICLVLTQTAILSAADSQTDLHPAANGLIGIAAGCGAALIGIVMTAGIRRIQNGKNYRGAFRKVKKLMKSEEIRIKIKPALISGSAGTGTVLYVTVQDNTAEYLFERLCTEVNDRLHMQLKMVK